MIKSSLIKALEELDKDDIYSLMLFALYRLKDTSEYATLSELVYLLDKETLFKFVNYYGGLTIRVPTMSELKTMLYALMMYQQINVEESSTLDDHDIHNILRNISIDDVPESDIKAAYRTICEVLSNYEFKKRK